MNILGLHFGHDASAAVVVDGEIAAYVQRERLARIKHAYSLDRATIDVTLHRANLGITDIDLVTVTSTQGCDPILNRLPNWKISYDPTMVIGPRPSLFDDVGTDPLHVESCCAESMAKRVFRNDPSTHPAFQFYLAEYRHIPLNQLHRFPWLDQHVELPEWLKPATTEDLAKSNIAFTFDDERCRYGFHYPLRVQVDDLDLPGVRVDHHLAHAASSYYRSGSSSALIVTNDGYGGVRTPFANGGLFVGIEATLIALMPHLYTHGHFYDYVARYLGIHPVGASGKLMGLAAYGEPVYFCDKFVGNRHDLSERGVDDIGSQFIAHALSRADQYSHDNKRIVDPHLPFTQVQLNLAASAQLLFEECWLTLVGASKTAITQAGLRPDTLCISGGSALNCPANTRLSRESEFPRLFIEPNCDDSGLAIGAALWAYHGLLGNSIRREEAFALQEVFGTSYSDQSVSEALEQYSQGYSLSRPEDPASMAAQDLHEARIVGWFEAGAEMGPRALGHRSILAAPRNRAMHYCVNRLKRRESWRPLAPSVLREFADKLFEMEGLSDGSPFMLLTAKVRERTLSAISHVDRTARLQTVDSSAGEFANVIAAYHRLSGTPVLLNTSMNGPGEPIVETPEEALKFLDQSGLDVLYLNGWRIAKRHGSSTD